MLANKLILNEIEDRCWLLYKLAELHEVELLKMQTLQAIELIENWRTDLNFFINGSSIELYHDKSLVASKVPKSCRRFYPGMTDYDEQCFTNIISISGEYCVSQNLTLSPVHSWQVCFIH